MFHVPLQKDPKIISTEDEVLTWCVYSTHMGYFIYFLTSSIFTFFKFGEQLLIKTQAQPKDHLKFT